jgi:hypothetical protein
MALRSIAAAQQQQQQEGFSPGLLDARQYIKDAVYTEMTS